MPFAGRSGPSPPENLAKRAHYLKRQFIAARDAAMTVWHFGDAMGQISTAMYRDVPTLRELVDRSILRSATKRFNECFRGAEAIRDAISHIAEFGGTLQKLDENSTKDLGPEIESTGGSSAL